MGVAQNVILLVEDNPDNSNLAQKILTHAGYQVEVVEDGEQALNWCESQVPQLILMDISLPGIDGLAVTRTLREREAFASLPIIALTAHALAGWDERCRGAGCDGYITKPIIPKEFIQQVEEALKAT